MARNKSQHKIVVNHNFTKISYKIIKNYQPQGASDLREEIREGWGVVVRERTRKQNWFFSKEEERRKKGRRRKKEKEMGVRWW